MIGRHDDSIERRSRIFIQILLISVLLFVTISSYKGLYCCLFYSGRSKADSDCTRLQPRFGSVVVISEGFLLGRGIFCRATTIDLSSPPGGVVVSEYWLPIIYSLRTRRRPFL